MKKLLFATAFIFTVSLAQAQDNSGVAFGIKAGPNFYNLDGEGWDGDSKIGIHGGLFVNVPISSMFSFNPELLFSQEGSKQEEGGDKVTFSLNYINLPLMLQYNNPSGFYGELGPQIGFLMSAKVKYDIGGVEDEEDVKDQLKSTSFSLGIGAGYDTPSGFGFGARYNFGLSSIVDEDDDDTKSSGFQISLRYKFGAKK